MHAHLRISVFLALALGLPLTLPSTSAFAQAGLSGDSLSGQTAEREGRNSKFDNGKLKSTSALGQLEEMTGSTVDRSSSQYSNHNTVTRPAPRPAPAKPRYDPNQAFRQELTTQLFAGVIAGLLSDDSAERRAEAEAEAARVRAAEAAAQAEAYRVQQELIRQARIRKAQHYRADWDSREGDITNRLGGAFDVGTGTAFFGRPANPDADVVAAILGQGAGGTKPTSDDDNPAVANSPDLPNSDPSVVDLQGSSLVVRLPQHPVPVAAHGRGRTIARSAKQAPATQKSDDNWQEDKPAPDPIIGEKYRKWWAKNHPYLEEKITDLELAYLFMAIKEMGGDSVQALASLPEKAKEAIDLKKNVSKHVQEYLESLFSIARQSTDFRADDVDLSDQVFQRFEASGADFQNDANKGMSGNFYLRIGGTLQEGSPQEAGIGIAQGLSSDLPERMKWGRKTEDDR